MMSESKSLSALAAEIKCNQINDQRKLVSVNANANLNQAIDSISEAKVWSVPVGDYAKDNFVGMFDFFDLAIYLLAYMKQKEFKVVGTLESSQDLDNQKHDNIVNFLKEAQIFQIGRINISLLTGEPF
jgi:predicted transcriptional regulator